MLNNNLIQSTSSWPFVEVRKLLKDRKDIIKKSNKITFQTGYGPSGLSHIGTFGEVARTTMMINALNHIQKIDHELITFSDDMDGLRKVPDNIPNDQVLKENLGKPLTNIPDPFKKFNSFGEHNNEMLKQFLNKFKFKFNFKSSTENYKKGVFNSSLIRVLEKYEDIMNIILPTLREERRKRERKVGEIRVGKSETVGVVHRDVERRRGERFVLGNAEIFLLLRERPDENLLQDDGKRYEIDITSRPGD